MYPHGSERTKMRMRQIDQLRVIVYGIDMQLKGSLRLQARRNDFAPDSGKHPSRHVTAMAREQPPHNRGFACRAERWRQARICRFTRPLYLRNRAAHLRPLNQKIMQSVVDLIDFAAQLFKRFKRFSHMRAIFRLLTFGSHPQGRIY